MLSFFCFQELVFNPYALGCGHLFCKSCVCTAASVMIFQGPKTAGPESKCPICREVNQQHTYNNLHFYFLIILHFGVFNLNLMLSLI